MAEEENPMDEHAHLIGSVTIAWNDAHHLVYVVFEDMLGDAEMADNLFFCLRSDASQRDLTLAAARAKLSDKPAAIDDLKTIFNTIGGLAKIRNEAIHTAWGIDIFSTDMEGRLAVGGVGKMRSKRPDDHEFTARFNKLREDLRTVAFRLLDWRRANALRI